MVAIFVKVHTYVHCHHLRTTHDLSTHNHSEGWRLLHDHTY
jgi:hypothetical protein